MNHIKIVSFLIILVVLFKLSTIVTISILGGIVAFIVTRTGRKIFDNLLKKYNANRIYNFFK